MRFCNARARSDVDKYNARKEVQLWFGYVRWQQFLKLRSSVVVWTESNWLIIAMAIYARRLDGYDSQNKLGYLDRRTLFVRNKRYIYVWTWISHKFSARAQMVIVIDFGNDNIEKFEFSKGNCHITIIIKGFKEVSN